MGCPIPFMSDSSVSRRQSQASSSNPIASTGKRILCMLYWKPPIIWVLGGLVGLLKDSSLLLELMVLSLLPAAPMPAGAPASPAPATAATTGPPPGFCLPTSARKRQRKLPDTHIHHTHTRGKFVQCSLANPQPVPRQEQPGPRRTPCAPS